jgi:hypothetical protein
MKRTALVTFIVALTLVCLWYTFKGVEFTDVLETIGKRKSAWPFFLLSGSVMMANILFRGFRFHRILSSHPEVGVKRACTMTGIMFLGNSILPLRAGEAIRIFLPYKLFGIPIASSAAFHGADRLFDLGGLLVLLAFALIFAGNTIAPEARTEPLDLFGQEYTFDSLIAMAQKSSAILLVVGILGVLAISLAPGQLKSVIGRVTRPLGTRWSDRLVGFVDHIHRGITVFRSPKDFFLATFWTIMVWWMVILNVEILSSVFGVTLNWAQAGIIVILVAVAVSLPQAPGYVGPFHLSFEMGLELCFGVPKTDAVAIALLAWFFQIFPVILWGFICLFAEGLSLHSFSEAKETLEQEDLSGSET